jgi:hypothetical protein
MESTLDQSDYITYSAPNNWIGVNSKQTISASATSSNLTITGSTANTNYTTNNQTTVFDTGIGRTSFISITGSGTNTGSATKVNSLNSSASLDSRINITNTAYTSSTGFTQQDASDTVADIDDSNTATTFEYTGAKATKTSQTDVTARFFDVSFSVPVTTTVIAIGQGINGDITTVLDTTTAEKTYITFVTNNSSGQFFEIVPETIEAETFYEDPYYKTTATTTTKDISYNFAQLSRPGIATSRAIYSTAFFTNAASTQITLSNFEFLSKTLFLLGNAESQPEVLWWPKTMNTGQTYLGRFSDIYSSDSQSDQTKSPQNDFFTSSQAATVVTYEQSTAGVTSANGSARTASNEEVTYETTFDLGIAATNSDGFATFSETITSYDTAGLWTSETIEGFFFGNTSYSQSHKSWDGSYAVETSYELLSSSNTTILISDTFQITYTTTTKPFINLPDTETTLVRTAPGLISTTHNVTYSTTSNATVSSFQGSPTITNRTSETKTTTQSLEQTFYTAEQYEPLIRRLHSIFAMRSLRRIFPQAFVGFSVNSRTAFFDSYFYTYKIEKLDGEEYGSFSLEPSDISTSAAYAPVFTNEQNWLDYSLNFDPRLKVIPINTNYGGQFFTITRTTSTLGTYRKSTYQAEFDSIDENDTSAEISVYWSTTTSTTYQNGTSTLTRSFATSNTAKYGLSFDFPFATSQSYYANSVYDAANKLFSNDRFAFGGFGTHLLGGAIAGCDYFTDPISVTISAGYVSATYKIGDFTSTGSTQSSSYSSSNGIVTLTFDPNRYMIFSAEPMFEAYLTTFGGNYTGEIKRAYANPGVAGEYDNL